MIDFQPAEQEVFFFLLLLLLPLIPESVVNLGNSRFITYITIVIEMELTGSICKLAEGWEKVV